MSRMMDIDHKRVRKYRVRSRRRDDRLTAGAEKAETTRWACVSLGPSYRDSYREERKTPERTGFRPTERPAGPEEPLWDERHERDLDYYYYAEEPDDFYAPQPRREGILALTGRWGADVWDRSLDRVGRVKTGGLKGFAVLAGVFAVGLIMESQLHFLGRAADLLAAAALALRGWLNPGVPIVLLLTGAVAVTGAWLLKWALRGPEDAPRSRKRVSIPRSMMERHF
ncbi:hypothetical protein [Candidatus Desulforudis audaxviator]|uniref:Uncharacterized protein n=1 Tax=Desulforudis audaxviator (strain MP104C) TaxID=477974 RepID=B1I6T2_DESAP|nr:hypothetical protein [Candidatus Desulforudis audaxviator]ACA60704.1 hypothetical protein Daud_2217 [Candidatus Desulforudis audaxviator MP104C]